MQNINRVLMSGNLTRDPELVDARGTTVCRLRLACNGRIKNSSGEWEDKPNYFDVTCFGALGQNVAKYLKKGSGLMLDGRLDWREWVTENNDKRQAVQIIAESIQFIDSPRGEDRGRSDDSGVAPPATVAPADDDIPF